MAMEEVMAIEGVTIQPAFINNDQATELLNNLLMEVPWQLLHWKGKPLKRMVYRATNGDLIYMHLKTIINTMTLNGIPYPKGIFLNLYRNPNDMTPYHKDSYGTNVYTLSLGATRTLRFKPDDKTLKSVDYVINSGDLYGFTQQVNNTHRHMVPRPTKKQMKQAEWLGSRISIVFFC